MKNNIFLAAVFGLSIFGLSAMEEEQKINDQNKENISGSVFTNPTDEKEDHSDGENSDSNKQNQLSGGGDSNHELPIKNRIKDKTTIEITENDGEEIVKNNDARRGFFAKVFTLRGEDKIVETKIASGTLIEDKYLSRIEKCEVKVTEKSTDREGLTTLKEYKNSGWVINAFREITDEHYDSLPKDIKEEIESSKGAYEFKKSITLTEKVHSKLTDEQKILLVTAGVIAVGGGVIYYYREPVGKKVSEAINTAGNVE